MMVQLYVQFLNICFPLKTGYVLQFFINSIHLPHILNRFSFIFGNNMTYCSANLEKKRSF